MEGNNCRMPTKRGLPGVCRAGLAQSYLIKEAKAKRSFRRPLDLTIADEQGAIYTKDHQYVAICRYPRLTTNLAMRDNPSQGQPKLGCHSIALVIQRRSTWRSVGSGERKALVWRPQ